jgi:predicted TIM-barrel fold metal-dependent hydrolase
VDIEQIRNELFAYAKSLDVIDAHDHLPTEEETLGRYLSFYDYLSSYVKFDLISAGMDETDLEFPRNEAEAVALFRKIEPFWRYVRYGSYARPVLRALEKFHGCADLTEETALKIGRELNERNKPGRFDDILRMARVEKILNQSRDRTTPYSDARFCYGILCELDYGERLRAFLERNPRAGLGDYIDAMDEEMARNVRIGAKLQKFFSDAFISPPNEAAVAADFHEMRRDGRAPCGGALNSELAHKKLELCAKHGIVAAVHAGVWGDVARLSPAPLFGVVAAHPDVVFDVYHMGIPYVRECAFLGKNFSNVYLNLCWSYCVSERIAEVSINEYLDIVPVNKIFGFGADVNTVTEHLWGQLEAALETLAAAFARRVAGGGMDMDYAKYVLRLWLYDNAKRVYKL